MKKILATIFVLVLTIGANANEINMSEFLNTEIERNDYVLENLETNSKFELKTFTILTKISTGISFPGLVSAKITPSFELFYKK